jgi:hypothetical protein
MGGGRRRGSPFQDPIPAYRLRRAALSLGGSAHAFGLKVPFPN